MGMEEALKSILNKSTGFGTSVASQTSPETKAMFASLEKTAGEIVGQYKDAIKSFDVSSVKGFAVSTNKLIGTLNNTLLSTVSSLLKIVDIAVAQTIKFETYMLARTTQGIDSGMSGAVNAFGGMIKDVMQKAAAVTGIQSFSAAGDMMNQVLSTAMSVFSLWFKDRLVANQAKFAAMYQVGGMAGESMEARGAQAAKTMKSLYGNFAREEAKQWGDAIMSQGAPMEKDLTDRMIRVGMSMGIAPGQMGPILDKFLVIERAGQSAGELMTDSFRAARAAAEGKI